MHQSELLKTNQPQQSIMLYKITHDQSTPSPEEDYRVAWKFCGFLFLPILRIELDPQKLVPAE